MNENQKMALVGLVGLAIGFAVGREQMKMQIASSVAEAFGNFGKNLTTIKPTVTTDTQELAGKSAELKKKEEGKDYAEKYMKLYDLDVGYKEAVLDGRVVAIDFKIKNAGDRIVTKACVTVFFQDASGANIAEQQVCPVFASQFNFGTAMLPLKPGYVWQQEKNKFYTGKQVPSEWKAGAATAALSDVEIE